MKVKMFFRVEEEGLYVKVSADEKNPHYPIEHLLFVEAMRKLLANQLDCDIEYIIPITEEEYLENTDEEIEV